jgi:calmodulin
MKTKTSSRKKLMRINFLIGGIFLIKESFLYKSYLKKSQLKKMTDIERCFKLYDKDQDGKIPTELVGTVIRACGKNPTETQVTQILKDVDPNGTGQVDFKSFQKVYNAYKNGDSDSLESIKEAFKIFDKNSNGFCPLSELRYSLTQLGEKITSKEFDELLEGTEVDKEGKLKNNFKVTLIMECLLQKLCQINNVFIFIKLFFFI